MSFVQRTRTGNGKCIAGAVEMAEGLDAVDVQDVDPKEVWSALRGDPTAVLIDVRTTAEWSYVGVPSLGDIGKKPILLEWQIFPSMSVNAGFATTLADVLASHGHSPTSSLYFLCRSGVRSKAAAAAMIRAGWPKSFNIVGGFEGALDGSGHRGAVAGWKASGLPWVQT